jgi:hypothetical protein
MKRCSFKISSSSPPIYPLYVGSGIIDISTRYWPLFNARRAGIDFLKKKKKKGWSYQHDQSAPVKSLFHGSFQDRHCFIANEIVKAISAIQI